MVYRLIKIHEREQKLHLYFDCRYNNLEIDHPLAATFLLLLSRTACLCFRVKVELRLPMTCLSSIFWIRGKSNETILQKTDSRNCRVTQIELRNLNFIKFALTWQAMKLETSAVFPIILPPEFSFHFTCVVVGCGSDMRDQPCGSSSSPKVFQATETSKFLCTFLNFCWKSKLLPTLISVYKLPT